MSSRKRISAALLGLLLLVVLGWLVRGQSSGPQSSGPQSRDQRSLSSETVLAAMPGGISLPRTNSAVVDLCV